MSERKTKLYELDVRDLVWRKSSASADEHECVEVAELPGGARAVRDSKKPDREPLRFTAPGWAAFRQGVISGGL